MNRNIKLLSLLFASVFVAQAFAREAPRMRRAREAREAREAQEEAQRERNRQARTESRAIVNQLVPAIGEVVESVAPRQPEQNQQATGPCSNGTHDCFTNPDNSSSEPQPASSTAQAVSEPRPSAPEQTSEQTQQETAQEAEPPVSEEVAQEAVGEKVACVNSGISAAEERIAEHRSLLGQIPENQLYEQHLDWAQSCAAKQRSPSQQVECKVKPDGSLLSSNFLAASCENIVKLDGIRTQLERGEAAFERRAVENYGSATNQDTIKHANIFEITKTFLKDQKLSEDYLQSYCAEGRYAYLSDDFIRESQSHFESGADEGPGKNRAYSISQCIVGNDALYRETSSSDPDRVNWKFFTNFSGEIGQLNYKKVCRDHAFNNCGNAAAFHYLCEAVDGEPRKEACKKDAREAIEHCLAGNYDMAYVPRDLYEQPLGQLYSISQNAQGEATVTKANGDFGQNQDFLSLPVYAQKVNGLSADLAQQDFSFPGFFHDAYATCVILRTASKKMANGEPNISLNEEVVSINGRNKCYRQVPWTVDFNYCVNTMEWGDGAFDIANAFGSTGIAMKESMDENKIQKEMASDAASGDQSAYINAQRNRLENSKENDYIRSSIAGTHAVALGGAATAYPAPRDLSEACDSDPQENVRLYGSSALNCGMAWVAYNHKNYANEGISVKDKNDNQKSMIQMIFSNQQIRKSFYHKAATKMAESIFHGVLGRQKGKQADDLNTIKKQYDEFFGQPAITPEYAGVNYCEQNPTAPSCRGSSRTSGAKLETGFESSGFQSQGGGNFSFNKIQDGFESEEQLSESERKARERLGDIIGNGGGKDFGDDIAPPGAAKGKYGKTGGAAGPGSTGGAGAAGGGKAPGPKKDNGKKTAQGMTKGKVNYQAGTGGINWKPGSSSGSKKKDRNAFQSMFGNKQKRNVATVLEGVSPASSKLFEKISKAYNKVKEEKKIYDFSKEDE